MILCWFSHGSSAGTDLEAMRRHFLHPPSDCRPRTRWWWMGNAAAKEDITWQLEEMADKGIGGVEQITMEAVYEKGNVPYLSGEYFEKLGHAVQTAKRLGMNVSINFGGPGWVIGGAWVPPRDRSKCLVPTSIDLEGPQTIRMYLPRQLRRPVHSWELPAQEITRDDQLLAVVAGKRSGEGLEATPAIVLTSRVKDGAIEWQVPEGRWRLMAFWLKYTGQGDAVDHFSRSAMRRYCEYLGGRFYEELGSEFGKTVDSFFCDSFEVALAPNGVYWSEGLLEEFQRRKGYDLTVYLPAVWWDMGEITPKIRYDVNEFLHQTGLEAFFQTFLDWCAEHGVPGRIQPYGFATDTIQGAGMTPIPEMEITAGEKDAVPWFDTRIGPKKYVASGAHLYGRNLVSAEAYTFLHWQPYRATLEELKIAGDDFLRNGANLFYNHGYTCLPERDAVPSRSMGAAIHISPDNVWWNDYPLLAEYLARCCWMLRQGECTADIAVYSPLANQWTLDCLNARRWTRDFDWGSLGGLITANGYDFDLLNDDIIQNHAVVEGGRLRVRHLQYPIIILPNLQALPLATLEVIQTFVRMGGTAIALERLPGSSTGLRGYPQNDQRLREIVHELFDESREEDETAPKRYGEGLTYCIKNVIGRTDPLDRRSSALDPFVNTLRRHVHPDFDIDCNREGMRQNDGLTFIHRRLDNAELYFVTNIQDRPVHFPVTFRVRRAVPQEWNPGAGAVRPLHQYRETPEGIEIPLALAPYESTFFLFETGEPPIHVTQSSFHDIPRMTGTTLEAIVNRNGVFSAQLSHGRGKTDPVRVDDLPAPLAVEGEWILTLEGREFPRIEKTLDRLESWTLDPQTRHFSGRARYDIAFEVPSSYFQENIQLELDPGKIGNVGEFWINETPRGTVWMRGQALDLTGALRPGANRMTVYVTNTLINRISHYTGPEPIPENLVPLYGRAVPPLPRGRHSPIGFTPLPPSGLLGPVSIIPYKKMELAIPHPINQ
ncbi:MAG: glycosyl hydrolase [bacterium]